MKLLLTILAILIAFLLFAWHWQANHATQTMDINVPRRLYGTINWIYGLEKSPGDYDFVIGKSQINPWGTLWWRQDSNGNSLNMPVPWPRPRQVKWLGNPVYARAKLITEQAEFKGVQPDLMSDDEIEIGLKPDGTVVWRRK